MNEQPINVRVQNYKAAAARYSELLILAIGTFPPSLARRYRLPVLNEKARQEAKAAYQRLGGHKEFEKVQRLRESLRRAVAEGLAQRPTHDSEAEGFLGEVEEYIEVKRKSTVGVEKVGKIPRLGGKAVRDLLRRWFGPGTYELIYVRDGISEGPARVEI